MYKRLSNNSPSLDNNQYINETLNIQQEYVAYEPTNSTLTDSVFDAVEVKEEPIHGERDEEDPLDIRFGSQVPANTIIKEEVMIECEPEMKNTETRTITTNQDKEHFSKKRKKDSKNRQNDTVLPLESEALDVITKCCYMPIKMESHAVDTMRKNEEYIYEPPVIETATNMWDRRFNCKEDIDLAATYDLDLKIVLKKYEASPILAPCDQVTICKSIVKCYLYEDHDRRFGIEDFIRMSKVIAHRFPSEVKETYYTKTKKTRARGKLYDQFQHFRGLLISVGLATKRQKRETGSTRESGRETDEDSGSET